jgi:hypothetical protein
MWGNRYFLWVGSKFTEGAVRRKIKGEICLAFLECLFYNITVKTRAAKPPWLAASNEFKILQYNTYNS